jgi:uncharacterized protein YndB with AHSA1/START domain
MTTRVVLGRLRHGPGGSAVHFERWYGTTPEDLWSALTGPDRLARWLAPVKSEAGVEGETGAVGGVGVGGEVRLLFGEDAVALVTVRECRPGQRLVLDWMFPDGLGSALRADLLPESDGVVLMLDHSGFPASPAEYAAAWQVNLDQLAAELVGQKATADYLAEFEQLRPHYDAAWRRLTAG